MSGDQRAEVRFAPPRWLIPWLTRAHVAIYRASRGRIGSRAKKMPHLLLGGVGRRSGRKFTVCLPYWLDEAGDRIIVASFKGAPKHPAWYHNVVDTSANPTVQIRDGRRVFDARVEILRGEEREELWRRLVADRPFYGRYQAVTTRRIPLLRIVEGAGKALHGSRD